MNCLNVGASNQAMKPDKPRTAAHANRGDIRNVRHTTRVDPCAREVVLQPGEEAETDKINHGTINGKAGPVTIASHGESVC